MIRYSRLFALATMAVVLPAIAACQQAENGKSSDIPEVPADAEDLVDVGTHMQLSASEALQEAMKDSFEPGQVTRLESVAHQMAIANYCDGFDLDADKAKTEMAKIGNGKEGSTVQPDVLKQKVTLALGMAMGSQLTVAANDPAAFCDHARDEKPENPGTEEGYILKSST